MDDWKRGDVVAHIVGEELNRNKSYQVVTRSGAVQAKLKALRRASGDVSGCDIRAWGRDHGVAYVCLITSPDNQNFSAQLFDVSSPLMQCSSSSISGFGAVDLKELAWTLTTELRSGCSAACGGYCEPEIGLEMVCVEGGTFRIGCYGTRDGNCEAKEEPDKDISISHNFWIGKYEVTQGQWYEIMGTTLEEQRQKSGETIYRGVGGPDYPMCWVSWFEANAFCDSLSARTGKKYRLATEAEWEYAARGGKAGKGYMYSGSNNPDDVAWYASNSGDTLHVVGAKAGNELGIYDMSGSLYEWCSSKYFANYNNTDVLTVPLPPSNTSDRRAVRGGACDALNQDIRNSRRSANTPSYTCSNVGFRVV
jgi:formylglycine-generating enzyme required for sulfatase activity